MNNSAFHFAGLTPDLILSAIESLAVYPETGLTALNSYENRVYQFRCDRGNRYVVKFYRPERWSREQLLEEHQFALELQQQEFPIAAPVCIDGATLHEYQGYLFTLFPSIGGRTFEVDNLEQLFEVGQFIGRMHQYARNSRFQHRRSLNPTTFGSDSIAVLQQTNIIPAAWHDKLLCCATELQRAIATRWQQLTPSNMRLHGDLHIGNILWTPAGPGFVDLDDACNGPAIQDLWMMLSGSREQQQAQLAELVEGYQEFCDFHPAELKLVELLRGLRMLHYNAWLCRRWDDPAFPRHFPWVAENQYWQQQCQSFTEQLAMLEQPPLSLIPY
ncbi:serine/threonine protein kinase [Shewanella avicenniae]|uniref:Stress response kinase A n=1 Tax=Shewanella avicenniae TaxID=2814294 RepID=A0ABX7QPQ7_9GAMM|nr:serine/threonine protein kinase [Shewanella avicenniae]QSX33384.1 serine/threonine protein kinase [Shewanella avicenniae]